MDNATAHSGYRSTRVSFDLLGSCQPCSLSAWMRANLRAVRLLFEPARQECSGETAASHIAHEIAHAEIAQGHVLHMLDDADLLHGCLHH